MTAEPSAALGGLSDPVSTSQYSVWFSDTALLLYIALATVILHFDPRQSVWISAGRVGDTGRRAAPRMGLSSISASHAVLWADLAGTFRHLDTRLPVVCRISTGERAGINRIDGA
jgi:hypothetical protein